MAPGTIWCCKKARFCWRGFDVVDDTSLLDDVVVNMSSVMVIHVAGIDWFTGLHLFDYLCNATRSNRPESVG